MGRLKLFGAVLSAMQIDATGRIAIVYLDHEMARAAGGTYEDTEGLINLPLTVKEIQAVVFFKQDEGDEYRVSMRSKGDIDIGAVAKEFGGGGHKNAAGCTVHAAPIDALQKTVSIEKIETSSRSHGRPARRRQARRPDVARRRRARAARARASGASATPARSIPLATGVLPLVVGRATRLARFLSAQRQGATRRSSASASRPTPTMREGAPIGAARRARDAVARRDRGARSTRSAARSCSSRRRSRRRRSTGSAATSWRARARRQRAARRSTADVRPLPPSRARARHRARASSS